MKKLLVALLAVLLLAGCTQECPECETCEVCPAPAKTVADLPAPRDTSKTYKDADGNEHACELNNYSVDCSSITSANLTDYLGIDGVVYIDARDYKDFATKHLRNFECIPYFALVFDAEANGADKPQLFSGSPDAPVATYVESKDLLNALIPTDKTVFLMCQSGGRIKAFMQLLEANGYDMTKIYNVGGMAQYDSYKDATVAEEIVVNATYAYNGLTLAK